MELLITAVEIERRIHEMAQEIIREYKDSNPLFISLLNGAVPFTADLMEAISELDDTFHPTIVYMATSTYGDGTEAKSTQITLDIDKQRVNDRTIIVIDDVLDEGITAQAVFNHLSSYGAKSVKLVVLVQKSVTRTTILSADIYGFEAPTQWLIGKGMNNDGVNPEAGRWKKDIWMLEK